MNQPRLKTGHVNLVGQRFGLLTVVEHTGEIYPQTTWNCRCDCGETKAAVSYSALTGKHTRSCGCLRSHKRPSQATHGKSNSKVHAAWSQMKQRCTNPARPEWGRYGGRGIEVCERWRDSFENFYADMGDPPDGYSLDRINNGGNYEPSNCRWADDFTQQRNRRNNRWFEWKGEVRTLTDIAALENVAFCSLRNKIFIMGMSLEQAITDCQERGLTYKEKAKAQRPQLAQFAELTEPRS